MKISVVITCYNLARYVGAAIDSVLHQEPGPYQVEIIVVDDHSTDDSLAVIHSYPECLLLANHENTGVLLATLRGMQAATGVLICLLDADDLWTSQKLRTVTEMFSQDPSIICAFHNYQHVDANGSSLHVANPYKDRLNSVADAADMDRQIRASIYGKGCLVMLGTATFRRDAIHLDEFAAWVQSLPDPRSTYQDWALAYWLATTTTGPLAYSPQVLLQYRLHGGNYSGDASTRQKMLRNLQKARSTRQAGFDLLQSRRPEQVRPIHKAQVECYDYLLDLYRGRTWTALKTFLNCVRHGVWSFSGMLKEVARIFGVAVLGPDRFLRVSK
jgi:glycosyltransferase involved in cell wall biosynthesis